MIEINHMFGILFLMMFFNCFDAIVLSEVFSKQEGGRRGRKGNRRGKETR